MLNFLTIISYCVPLVAYSQNEVSTVKPVLHSKAAIITGSALVGDAALYAYGLSSTPPSPSQLNALSTSHIPPFERYVTTKYNTSIAHISDAGVACVLVAPALLLFDRKIDRSSFALHYVEALSITALITQSCKTAFPRYRPYTYNTNLTLSDRQTTDARQSFFSLHTSLASAATFYMASFLNHKVHTKGARIALWTAAIVLPAAVGYMRVAAGEHFITDVGTGYIVGAACGVGTYYFSR